MIISDEEEEEKKDPPATGGNIVWIQTQILEDKPRPPQVQVQKQEKNNVLNLLSSDK